MIVHKRLCAALLSLILVLASTQLVRANGFTIEQILSAPFPTSLIASPKGDRVAWVFYSEGRRNIWVAEAPAFQGRQLTRYDKDDGQEVTQLIFSPDASWIAYVRGGGPNRDNEIPNPMSDPAGARQEIWIVNTRTGATTKITEGTAPAFSPAGDRITFSRENHLWTVPVPTGTAKAAAKKMFEIRGAITSPAWSPDGSRLAFVSSRGDHNFIAVYDARQQRITFLDPSIDRDIEPRWSADGKRIAFVRLFNVADTFSADKERVQPWAIRVVDVASGKAKEIWRSGNADWDSFSRVMFGENVLQWAAGDRIVFGSEKDGWAHLYSIAASGGEAALLTPGNYEVENVAWSPDRSFIVVASNAGAINHRHLWKVSVAGGKTERLTDGDSIEMNPVIVDGGRQIAFLHATPIHPMLPHITSINGKGTRALAAKAMPASFPHDLLVAPESVTFKAADGIEVHGQLFRPKNAAGRRPAVVFMHGGPMRQMLPVWHYRHYYHNAYAFNQYLASRGYVVLSVNYRSGIGYGRSFREAKHRGARGASEYQDIVAAGKYLRSRDDVDAKRIGLWGGSYGGYLTALGLARDSDMFAAGVDLHGVHDWSRRIGAAPTASGDLIRLGRDSSPISSVDKWKSPVLLIHGDDDRNVDFGQTVELARRLRERGVKFEEITFPDEVHDFLRHENWLRAYKASADFFDRYMR